MWRLIVVTSAFIALIFFEMSGGTDYAPVEHSLQVQGIRPHLAKIEDTTDDDPALSRLERAVASTREEKGSKVNVPILDITRAEDFQTRKAVALTADPQLTRLAPDADEAAILAALKDAGAEMDQSWPGAIELFARAAQEADLQRALRDETQHVDPNARDLRIVEGDLVNMRGGPGTEFEKITALTGGTEVVVLHAPGNGWLELQVLETGQVGWMADWLVSEATTQTGFAGTAAGQVSAN